MATQKDRPPAGGALVIARWLQGWSQEALERIADIKPGSLTEYERGRVDPSPPTQGKILKALNLRQPELDALADVLASYQELMNAGDGRARAAAVTGAAAGALRAALELSRVALEVYSWTELKTLDAVIGSKKRPPLPAAAAGEEAEALLARLRRYKPSQRRAIVYVLEEFWNEPLIVLLCEESAKAAANDPAESLECARLARSLAELMPGERRRRRLGYVWGFEGNSLRVLGSLPAAEEAFRTSRDHRQAGAGDDPGPFEEARLLDLEASLLRAQRRLPEALDLLGQALAADQSRSQTARVLVKRAKTMEELDRYPEAIANLQQAFPQIDREREPRLWWAARFNLAENVAQMDNHAEAQAMLPEVRALTEALGNDLDGVRFRWLEGRLAAGLKQEPEALAAFEEVRQAFLTREIAYDTALVSLELAVLHAERGRTAEVKQLAAELLPVFEAQEVKREAYATVQLFCHAAEREAVTAELARSLLAELRHANRTGPEPQEAPARLETTRAARPPVPATRPGARSRPPAGPRGRRGPRRPAKES